MFNGYGKRVLILLILLCFFMYPHTIYGFLPPKDYSNRNISRKRPHFAVPYARREKVLYSLSEIDGGRLESTHDSRWRAIINPYTNMPSRIYGGRAKVDKAGRAFYRDGSFCHKDLINACKDFIDHHQGLFKVMPRDLKIVEVKDSGWIRYVHFQQYYKEKVVYGAYLTFIIDGQDNIVSMNMNIFPDIDVGEVHDVDWEACKELIRADLGAEKDGIEFISQEEVVYPIADDSGMSFCRAVCSEVKIANPLQRWRYCMDGQNLRILEKKDLAHYMVRGRVEGEVLPEYYDDIRVEVALSDLKMTLLKLDAPLYFNPFDTDPLWTGISPGYGWEFGRPEPRDDTCGGPDPSYGHTGMTVYGYNLKGPYPLRMTEPEYLTMTQPIDCLGTEEVGLLFWRWLGVKGSLEDRATIEIWENTEESWQGVWENEEKDLYDGGWHPLFYDISNCASGNPEVRLRWGMGPTNRFLNYCGWNIDDVGLYRIIQTYSDKNGDFEFSGEDFQNMLHAVLEGKYFKVRNNKGNNIRYTQYITRDSQDQNVHLTRMSTYDETTGMGVLNVLNDIDEINVYYHANKMIHYIREIDPDFLSSCNQSFLPINITVRYDKRYNNAFWLAGEGIFFGEGDGFEFRNFAHFSDIIYHEVTHAITDFVYGYLRGRDFTFSGSCQRMLKGIDQFDAMHEAFSDYWACTVNDDSKLAESGFWIFAEKDCVRDLENDFHYLTDFGYELYESSLILSSAMWNVRQRLKEEYGADGVRIADTLFHFAREAMARTFTDFLLDVLLIDEIRYDAAYEELILDSFGAKEIGLPPPPPTSMRLEKTIEGIRIYWEKSLEAVGYCIYYQEEQESSLDKEDEQTNFDPHDEDKRVDVGDRDSYLLIGLHSGEYVIKMTSYNKYGVESTTFAEKSLFLDGNPRVLTFGARDGIIGHCFIGIL